MTIQIMKESSLRHELIYGAPVLAYAGLIFLLSSISKFPDILPSFFGFDKLAHFSEYFFFRMCDLPVASRRKGSLCKTSFLCFDHCDRHLLWAQR